MSNRTLHKLHDRAHTTQASPSGVSVQLRQSLARALGKRLNELGWSQKRLAEEMGCHEPYVSQLLHGEANFTVNQAAKALHAVGITLTGIINWHDVGPAPAGANVRIYHADQRRSSHGEEENDEKGFRFQKEDSSNDRIGYTIGK